MSDINLQDKSQVFFDEIKASQAKLFLQQYNRLMAYYRCAMMDIETKFNVLNEEFSLQYDRNPISDIKTRLKNPMSIKEKLERRNFSITIENIEKNLNDIAGVRVVCAFPDDVYMLADALLKQDDIKLIEKIAKNRYLFRVHCSAGTYIRTLFSDIANKLGTISTTPVIIRTKSGRFAEESAVTLEELEQNKKIIEIEELFSPKYYILSGGPANPVPGLTESEAMYNYLVNVGFDKTKLIKEMNSYSTVENAKFSVPIALELGADIIIVCSSAYHFENPGYKLMESFVNEIKDKNVILMSYCK